MNFLCLLSPVNPFPLSLFGGILIVSMSWRLTGCHFHCKVFPKYRSTQTNTSCPLNHFSVFKFPRKENHKKKGSQKQVRSRFPQNIKHSHFCFVEVSLVFNFGWKRASPKQLTQGNFEGNNNFKELFNPLVPKLNYGEFVYSNSLNVNYIKVPPQRKLDFAKALCRKPFI